MLNKLSLIIYITTIILLITKLNSSTNHNYARSATLSCNKLPARHIKDSLNNSNNSSMPTCFSIHKNNSNILNKLKSKEDFIMKQFKDNNLYTALDIMKLLYQKSINNNKSNHNMDSIKKDNDNNESYYSKTSNTFYYIIIGDSMSKQSFYTFACELEYYHAIEINISTQDTVKYYIQNHPNYHYLNGANSDYYLHDNFMNRHKELKYILSWNHINNNIDNNITVTIAIHMIFIWKVGHGKGPGIVGNSKMTLQSRKPFEDLLINYLGIRNQQYNPIIIIYNEGFHHQNQIYLRFALQYPLKIFQNICDSKKGPYIFIRESNAVHFQSLPHTKPGYIGLYQSANLSINHCINTPVYSKIWMNDVIVSSIKGKNNIQLIPFYAISSIWSNDIHFYPDCLHPSCYTPYFWLPLYDSIYRNIVGIPQIPWDMLISSHTWNLE